MRTETFPAALGTMLGVQLVTRQLYWRLGPRRVVAMGLLVIAATTDALASVTLVTGLWVLRAIMAGLGLGVSFVFVPSQAAAMATVDKRRTGSASALFNAGKQVGAAVGVAVLGSVLGSGPLARASDGRVDLTGFHAGFLVAAATAVLALGVALTDRDVEAAATITDPRPGRRASLHRDLDGADAPARGNR